MRIGLDLVAENGCPGGIHTCINRTLEAMVDCLREPPPDLEQDWQLVVFAHDDFQWAFPIDRASRVEVIHTGYRGLSALRRRLLQQTVVPALARRAGVDLVHSFNNVLPLRLPVPGVVTVNDLSPWVTPRRFGFLKRRFLRWAVPRSIRAARRVIAISRNTQEEILHRFRGVDSGKVRLVPPGVDSRFHPRRDPGEEERLRARHRLPGSFLLYVGAAEPGKNLPRVVRALDLLAAKKGLTIPWVLAGVSGSHLEFLEREWRRSPHLDPGGFRALGVLPESEVTALFRMARTFVFPSLYEGFGLPVLEALASGTPVITSGGNSAPREVAGDAAITVDPESVDEIARAIERVWSHQELRALLRMRGPQRAQHFTWRSTAEKNLRVYREVARPAELRPSQRVTAVSGAS